MEELKIMEALTGRHYSFSGRQLKNHRPLTKTYELGIMNVLDILLYEDKWRAEYETKTKTEAYFKVIGELDRIVYKDLKRRCVDIRDRLRYGLSSDFRKAIREGRLPAECVKIPGTCSLIKGLPSNHEFLPGILPLP